MDQFLTFWRKLTLKEQWTLLKRMTQEEMDQVAEAINARPFWVGIGAGLNRIAYPEKARAIAEAFGSRW